MYKILMLARANIRKAKGQTATLAALFLVSSMMLNIGLAVMLRFGSFFDRMAEGLGTSDAFFCIPEALYTDEVERYFASHGQIDAYQKNSGIVAAASYDWKGEPFSYNIAFWDMDEPRGMSRWEFVGDQLPRSPDAIYVPYLYKLVGGYGLGDGIDFEINGKFFHFTVSGYTDCIYQDRMMIGDVLFVPGQRFAALRGELEGCRRTLVFASGAYSFARAESDLLELTGLSDTSSSVAQGNTLYGADLASIKNSRTSMPSIMSMMMVMFTAVVAAACLLVIRFRIGNGIEEDMQRIGSLKSIGYTSRQIALSVAAQYGIVAFAACLVGVAPAYLALPFVGDVLAQQSGLLWHPGAEPAIGIASVGALTLIVVAVALLAAAKVRKASPVQALRGGVAAQGPRRSYIPLGKSRMPLAAALSMKSVLQGMRQSATTFAVLAAVSFTAAIAVILYYNSAVDLSAFEKVPGIERSNAALVFAPGEPGEPGDAGTASDASDAAAQDAAQDAEAMRAEVAAHPDVWKAQYVDFGRARVDGIDAGAVVMSDFSGKETVNVYEGAFPSSANEIAVAGLLAGMVGKGIGDVVPVGPDGSPFVVTGLAQGMEAGPMTVYLTLDGMREITPGFTQAMLNVYLNKGASAAAYVEEMASHYGGRLATAIDADASFAEGVSSYASIMSIAGIAILAIAGFVIVLILYFVIGSAIVRRRRELGIQKAIGFTTAGLMGQTSLGFAFPLTLGAAAGCAAGAAAVNALMSLGLSSMGVMKADFIVDPAWVAAAGLCIVALSYLASVTVTWRIRKISAYALIME